MEMIEQLTDYLRKLGIHNYLAIGGAVVAVWLLLSGLIRGLRKGKSDATGDEKEE